MSEHLNERGSFDYKKEVGFLADYINHQGALAAIDLFIHPNTTALDRVFIRDAAKHVIWSSIPEKGNYELDKSQTDLLEALDLMDAYIDSEITASLERVTALDNERIRTEPIPTQQSELERAS